MAEPQETTRLFQTGDFTLASGQRSAWKIECDALTADDWDALALMLAERLPPFSLTYGVPTGGEPIAKALSKHTSHRATRALVVDDVWTTGGSMTRYIASKQDRRAIESWRPLRAVVFARNPVPDDVVALFTLAAPSGVTDD